MIHAHIALWIVGSPRFDKINVPKQLPSGVVEVEPDTEDVRVHSSEEAAKLMACFWDRVVTEWNVAKAYEVHKGTAAAPFVADAPPENVSASSHPRASDGAGVGEDSFDNLSKLRDSIGPRRSMGTKAERATVSPESISVETYLRCLLDTKFVSQEESDRCWKEFDHIMARCARCVDPTPSSSSSPLAAGKEGASAQLTQSRPPSALSSEMAASSPLVAGQSNSDHVGHSATAQTTSQDGLEHRRARARSVFVSALAEWVNMHDYHEPFANGAPSAHQSCAAEDKGRIYCNKLYPRQLVHPGKTEIMEDPRRRELFRLWLGRNCHFLNNFVPIILLAMLSNCDFQATLTKDAVIEYMTKYMTKSGQGSLVKVMEQSFSLCLEKARDKQQGSGAAMLKWFNVQSITEVKSQLETMHLIFAAPRYICSRDFSDLWLRSDMRKIKSPQDIAQAADSSDKLVTESELEKYWGRLSWSLPHEQDLLQEHPLTGVPLWHSILSSVRPADYDGASLAAWIDEVRDAWPTFVELLSWWKLKRFFDRKGSSIKYKAKANIVVVHPEPRFTTAMSAEQWREACVVALVAFCNHGPCCAATTFTDLRELESLSADALDTLMSDFVHLDSLGRSQRRIVSCPPHVSRAYTLGRARRDRMEQRRAGRSQVTAALPHVQFVFEDDKDEWQRKSFSDMSADESVSAVAAWANAEAEDVDEAKVRDSEKAPGDAEEKVMHERMKAKLREWQVSVKELHNAVLAAGLQVPARPSWLNYPVRNMPHTWFRFSTFALCSRCLHRNLAVLLLLITVPI